MKEHTLNERIQLWIEGNLLGRLAPTNRPGWLLTAIFRIPIGLYRAGLGAWVGPHFLMIRTTGRKSGRQRYTVLEWSACPHTGLPLIMSGWGDRSDWVRNLRADPRCEVWIGKASSPAQATPLAAEEVAELITAYLANAPSMQHTFERFSGIKLDGSSEALLATAPYFPCFRLRPLGSQAPDWRRTW